MLTHITIKYFTIIDSLSLDFSKGMTVITGETGSGKSIVIDAIDFALGVRTSKQAVFPGAERAEVTLSFTDIEGARAFLSRHDLDEEDECIIRRVLSKDGRSRYTINGTPCTAKLIREFSTSLICIHGQHAHQALLKSDEQRALLDRYADHEKLLAQTTSLYTQWKDANEKLQTLKSCADNTNQLEFIRYQLREFEELSLNEGELDELHAEHKQLHHAIQLGENCGKALDLLQGKISESLNTSITLLEEANQLLPHFTSSIELLKNAVIQIDEATDEVSHKHIASDPARLSQIELRLDRIQTLARKHKVQPEALHSAWQELIKEQDILEGSEDHIKALEADLKRIQDEYQIVANTLSKSRSNIAAKLSKAVTANMHKLSIEGGELKITVERDETSISPHGHDIVNFIVKTNPGQPFMPMQRVVSGGELSRISLAIQVITAQKSSIPTLVFDEVDVGIGGKTADIVGGLLHKLGKLNQLFCITHLPQVAAKGEHHITVEKTQCKDTTLVDIKTLNAAERIKEIARMLGGVKISNQTLAHAKELLA